MTCVACGRSWSLSLYLRPMGRFDRGAERKREARARVDA